MRLVMRGGPADSSIITLPREYPAGAPYEFPTFDEPTTFFRVWNQVYPFMPDHVFRVSADRNQLVYLGYARSFEERAKILAQKG